MSLRALAPTVLAVAALARPPLASAQIPFVPDARHAAFVDLGLEPELVLSAGWLRALPTSLPGPPLAAGIGLKLAPVALVDHAAWRVNLLLGGDARAASGLGAAFGAAAYLVHDRSDVGTMDGLGLELRVAPGLRGARWEGGLDLGWQGTLLAHVRHSDLVRRTFDDRYPAGVAGASGPRAGWYGSTAHRFRLGLQGEHAFTERVALSLALGMLASYQRQGVIFGVELAQVPIYVETAVRVGW